MNNKVKRVYGLLAIAFVLFIITEMVKAPWILWVRGASAGFALGGVVGVILIFSDVLKERR